MPVKTALACAMAAFLAVSPPQSASAVLAAELLSAADTDASTMKRLGISKGATISDEDFLLFLKRVRANPELNAALEEARRDGIRIYATSYFLKGSRAVLVNVHEADEAIIEFVRKR